MRSPKYISLQGILYQITDSVTVPKRRTVAAIWAPSKGDSDITADKLSEAFPDLDEELANQLAAEAKTVTKSTFDDYLGKVDAAIDAFGIEPLSLDGEDVDRFGLDWDEREIAYYVNTGDTYNATLLYDPEDNTIYLTTFGDWLEAWEYEKELEMADNSEGLDDSEDITEGAVTVEGAHPREVVLSFEDLAPTLRKIRSITGRLARELGTIATQVASIKMDRVTPNQLFMAKKAHENAADISDKLRDLISFVDVLKSAG